MNGRSITHSRIEYRADIDGLRGIAVLAVVIYHAYPEWLPGGFMGVDVFFVISGYLITKIIRNEQQSGAFKFTDFLERRARRLLPALLVMLLAVTVVATLVMLPDDFKEYSKSLAAAVGFVANFHFYLKTGYFEGPAEAKPLLHTWSLAVEEQFYMFWPLLLTALAARSNSNIVRLAAVIGAASFVLNLVGTHYWPSATFYMIPMRAWEFMLGCVVALSSANKKSALLLIRLASVVGGLLLIGSLSAGPMGMGFPGFVALLPSIGTALLIWTGGLHSTTVSVILKSPPLVKIGFISYSLYLWHWPLLSLARYQAQRELGGAETAALVAMSFAIAVLSWFWVEQPLRRTPRRVLAASGGLLAVSVLLVWASIGMTTQGLPGRWPTEAKQALEAYHRFGHSVYQCFNRPAAVLKADGPCRVVSSGGAKGEVFLWGDSHAEALAPAVREIGLEHGRGVAYFARSACLPLVGVYAVSGPAAASQECREANSAVMAYLSKSPPAHVLLVGRWSFMVDGPPSWGVERNTASIALVDETNRRQSNDQVVERGLVRTLEMLFKAGHRVTVVKEVPYVGVRVPSYVAMVGQNDGASITLPVGGRHRASGVRFNDILRRVGASRSFTVIDPAERLCKDNDCLIVEEQHILYRDDDHLTQDGARILKPLLNLALR